MKLKAPTVLYWIASSVPTPEQIQDSMQYGTNVRIRNADHDTKDGALEAHDYVAGPDIPKRYTDDTIVDKMGATVPNPFKRPMAIPFTQWLSENMPTVDDVRAKKRPGVLGSLAADGYLNAKGGGEAAPAPDTAKNTVEKTNTGVEAGWS